MVNEAFFKNKTVMVIDDCPMMMTMYKKLLDKEGITVIACLDSTKAIDIIKQNEVDCVILDYMMPKLSGLEVCKQFKGDEGLSSIPIIMITSNEGEEYLLNCIEAGADDFLNKTSTKRVILAKVHAMLRLSHLHKEVIKFKQLAAMDSMVVTLNHEFNNVVAILNGKLSLFRKTLDESKKENVEPLRKSLARLVSLIKKVKSIKEYREVEYSGDTKMIDLHSEDEEKKAS
jgi:DNA-binding response OmpR family regulator